MRAIKMLTSTVAFAIALSACSAPSGGASSSLPSSRLVKRTAASVPWQGPVATTYAATIPDFATPSWIALATLRAMHISTVRFDLGSSVQEWAAAESVIAVVKAEGLSVLLITPYLPTAASATQANYNAYAAEVAKLAPELFGIELMNEPDNEVPRNEYGPTPAQYVSYATTIAASARLANPALVISSGGTSGYDPTWLAAVDPVYSQVSCVGVHPYGVAALGFGALWATITAAYGKPACATEVGGLSVGDTALAIAQSSGVVPIFCFYDLAGINSTRTVLPFLAGASTARAPNGGLVKRI